MLDRLLPRPGVPPWDLLPWAPLIHAAVFVHRVRGLAPGLYLFERVRGRPRTAPAACATTPSPGAASRWLPGPPAPVPPLAAGDLRARPGR